MIFDFVAAAAKRLHPARTRKIDFPAQADQVLFLRNMVTAYRSKYPIRQWATTVIQEAGCPPRRRLCQAIAIARWVQKNVYYVNEGDETFQTPLRTLENRMEDCDGFSTLIATGLEAIGISTELVAMWMASPPHGWRLAVERAGMPWELTRTGSYKHIFPRALIPKGGGILRVPLDATLDQPAGSVNPVTMAVGRGDKIRLLVL